MDIEVVIGQTLDVRRQTRIKNAPAIARGIFLSGHDVRKATEVMLKKSGVHEAHLLIVFLDGRAMRRLNRQVLGHDYVTDVITFDLGSKASHVSRLTIDGEIYICPSEAKRNAKVYGESVEREILRYIAHGILHLLGWDDQTEAKRCQMRKKEDDLLDAFCSKL
ncbi:MAG: rRNA maturation RNase YbeY [Candidatus Omnitrophica bacterium]|nr:rRNA maturation RNase YbeY [Candidatus Omnitrophota bacterium]